MTSVQYYRVKRTYEKPHGGFLAVGTRYAGVLSEDGLTVLFTHPGDRRWHEVVDIAHLEEAPDPPPPRRHTGNERLRVVRPARWSIQERPAG